MKSKHIDNDAGTKIPDQDINMEDIFKQTYTAFAFTKLPFIELNSDCQKILMFEGLKISSDI